MTQQEQLRNADKVIYFKVGYYRKASSRTSAFFAKSNYISQP